MSARFHTPPMHLRAIPLVCGVLAGAALMFAATGSRADAAFDARMSEFVTHIKDDAGYKRIPLQTPSDREWFYRESERVYEHKLTKEEFVAEGTQRFPGYESSFSQVADFMASPR